MEPRWPSERFPTAGRVDIEPVLKALPQLNSGWRPLRMSDSKTHRWQFAARFRRNAFGRRSRPAIERVHEAVAEIRKTARRDPILAAEGAVLFIEKVSPALEHATDCTGRASKGRSVISDNVPS
jgi:hypothetical protein